MGFRIVESGGAVLARGWGARSGPVKSRGPLNGSRGASSTPPPSISSSARVHTGAARASSTRRLMVRCVGVSVSFASVAMSWNASRKWVVAALSGT